MGDEVSKAGRQTDGEYSEQRTQQQQVLAGQGR